MNKQEFKARANQTIDEVSAKINELKAESASTEEDIRKQIDDDIKNLELKESQLKSRLNELETASEEQWKNAKDAFSTVREKYKDALSTIQNKLETTA